MTLSEKIRTQRKRLGLSQEALGEELGVSRQAVTKWESGAAIPESDKITMLSQCFGVSTDYLLKEDMDVPKEIIAHVVIPPKKKRWFKIIGISMLILFVVYILVLLALSFIFPVSYMDWDGGHITGFLGFIEIYRLWLISSAMLVIGLLGIVFTAIDFLHQMYISKKKRKPGKENKNGNV